MTVARTYISLAQDRDRVQILLPLPQVVGIMSNVKLSERFLALARDLDVLEPKVPEDVYKMHLVDTHRSGLGPSMDSAAKNLSATLVNALVNLGFGNDKLVTIAQAEGERTWISRNKDQGKTCAVASIGVRLRLCVSVHFTVRPFLCEPRG